MSQETWTRWDISSLASIRANSQAAPNLLQERHQGNICNHKTKCPRGRMSLCESLHIWQAQPQMCCQAAGAQGQEPVVSAGLEPRDRAGPASASGEV